MNDLFTPETQKRIYTVAQVTAQIKQAVDSLFHQVWVEGEISNLRPSGAGHMYFSLKDDQALLSSVIFARIAANVKFRLEDGLRVICSGRVEVYAPRGQYQMIIDSVEPKGIGSLQLALEQLKEKLEKEGLFSPERKRPLPYLPSRIGIVTSPTGAAIKDILQVLERRFRDVELIISPVRVQGEGAKEDIASAIEDFNRYNRSSPKKVDVLIVGRGGGSIEDLWAFNEEIVARAIYASKIPVISAVGHERDVTISDLVADLRAPTPSAAAELVLPRKEDLREKLEGLTCGLNNRCGELLEAGSHRLETLQRRLTVTIGHAVEVSEGKLSSAAKKLSILNPSVLIPQHIARIHDLARQIFIQTDHILKLRYSGLAKAAERLCALNPLNILSRGYSVTFKDGGIVKSSSALSAGDVVRTRLHQGEFTSTVTDIRGQ